MICSVSHIKILDSLTFSKRSTNLFLLRNMTTELHQPKCINFSNFSFFLSRTRCIHFDKIWLRNFDVILFTAKWEYQIKKKQQEKTTNRQNVAEQIEKMRNVNIFTIYCDAVANRFGYLCIWHHHTKHKSAPFI